MHSFNTLVTLLVTISCMPTVLGHYTPAPSKYTCDQVQAALDSGHNTNGGAKYGSTNGPSSGKIICKIEKFGSREPVFLQALHKLCTAHSPDQNDDLTLPAGPRRCTRIFCSEGVQAGAIRVCNDNDHSIKVPYSVVIGYVANIWDQCSASSHGLNGQQFHPTMGWNVIAAPTSNGICY